MSLFDGVTSATLVSPSETMCEPGLTVVVSAPQAGRVPAVAGGDGEGGAGNEGVAACSSH